MASSVHHSSVQCPHSNITIIDISSDSESYVSDTSITDNAVIGLDDAPRETRSPSSYGGRTPLPIISSVATPQTVVSRRARKTLILEKRNARIVSPSKSIALFTFDHMQIFVGATVELLNGSFVRITHIVYHEWTHAVNFRGRTFVPIAALKGQFDHQSREVIWKLEIDIDDGRCPSVQSINTYELSEIKCLRSLHITGDGVGLARESDATHYCKWKMLTSFRDAKYRLNNKPSEQVLQVLDVIDYDYGFQGVRNLETARFSWRENTMRGGICTTFLLGEKEHLRQEEICDRGVRTQQSLHTNSGYLAKEDPMQRGLLSKVYGRAHFMGVPATGSPFNNGSMQFNNSHQANISHLSRGMNRASLDPARPLHSIFRQPGHRRVMLRQSTLNITPDQQIQHLKKRRYTMLDAFCGGGGMSRAAVQTGIRVIHAFDKDAASCETYARNLLGAEVFQLSADEYVALVDDTKCDIVHFSPPCQFFSPAHTNVGRDDERNTASMFAIGEILDKCRPRIAILEETFGLQHQAHTIYLNALLRMFTSRQFSIRRRVINSADYGLPQSRKRLWIIAACPGENLPSFPPPTHAKPAKHGESQSLPKWRTASEALAGMPDHWTDHSPLAMAERDDRPRQDDIITCICTGTAVRHPTGLRNCTLREIAVLQGFPLCHKFGPNGARKQIGNAVPPLVGKAILQDVVKCLRASDGIPE